MKSVNIDSKNPVVTSPGLLKSILIKEIFFFVKESSYRPQMIIQRMLRSFYSDETTESSDGSRSPFRLRLNAMDDLLEDAPPIRIDFDSELDVSYLFYFCY